MIKKNILKKLQVLGCHIGHQTTSFNSELNYYILGKRFNFVIIDLNKSFLLLKKALFFTKNLSANNGSMLFYYSRFSQLSWIYKCVLLTISKNSYQQMITFN